MKTAASILVAGILAATNVAWSAEYRAFHTRPGVVVPAIIVAPDQPKVVAVLFSGGDGTIGIKPDGTIRAPRNFLISSRVQIAERGIVAVAIDAPSDQTAGGGRMEDYFRETSEHADDIRLVIAALRKTYGLPVWLLGTSRGSTSVANAGIRLQRGGLDGLVLMSAIFVKHKRGGSLLRMSLSSIKVPTLVVHHVDDGCGVTPLEGARDIHGELTGAPVIGLI